MKEYYLLFFLKVVVVVPLCFICLVYGKERELQKVPPFINNIQNSNIFSQTPSLSNRKTRNYDMCLGGEYHDPNNTYSGVSFCCDDDCTGTGGEFSQLFTPSQDQLPWKYTQVFFFKDLSPSSSSFFGLTTLFQICVLLRVDESAFNQTITLEVDMYEDDFGTPSQVPFRSKTVDVFLDDILVSVVVDVSENDFGSLLCSRNYLSTLLSGLHKDCVLICKLLWM